MGTSHILTTEPQHLLPPPSPSSSFPILAISIVGILATAILLLSYYVFVIKCCRNWRRSDVLSHLTRSRRQWHTAADRYTMPSLYLSTIANQGMDESTIQAIPTLQFSRGELQNSLHDCAVCLNEFQQKETIRMLPNCLHAFHIDCIDTWLQTHVNCPLCRTSVTSTITIPVMQPNLDQVESAMIDVRDEDNDHQTPRSDASNNNANRAVNSRVSKEWKLHKISSMGDECIDLRSGRKNEQFAVQPMRRSFSMDSSSDSQLYRAVQEILRQNPHFRDVGNSEGTSTGLGRTRRSFFSFSGHSRSSKNHVLPIKNQQ